MLLCSGKVKLDKTVFYFIIILSTFYPGERSFSQSTHTIDSRLKPKVSLPDIISHIDTLLNKSKELNAQNKRSEAITYAEAALQQASEISYTSGEVAICKHLGMLYTYDNDAPEARKHFYCFLHAAEKTGDQIQISDAYICIANSYFQQGNFSDALEYHFTALKIKLEINHLNDIHLCYSNIAQVYWNLGDFPLANSYYKKALAIAKENKNEATIARTHEFIGLVKDEEGYPEEALNHFFLALELYEKLNLYSGMAACYENIGKIYEILNNHQEALNYFLLAQQLYTETNNMEGQGDAFVSISDILRENGDYNNAEINLVKAIAIYEESQHNHSLAEAYQEYGRLFYEQAKSETLSPATSIHLSSAKENAYKALALYEASGQIDGMAKCCNLIGLIHIDRNEFKEARNYLSKSLSLAKKSNVKKTIQDSYLALARLDSSSGQWQEAFQNQRLYFQYRDSLINLDNTRKITQLQMQFEFKKKEDSLRYWQDLSDRKLSQQMLLSQQHAQRILLQDQELSLSTNEKHLQQLEIDKKEADLEAQKMISENNKAQLALLEKATELSNFEAKKQRTLKNYLIGGLVLLGSLSVFAYTNYITRQKLKWQTLRNKIARDLHDDVGSTLSSISIFSEIAQKQSKEVIPHLASISESSQKMLEAMADIVWTINPENDQFERILLRMKSFASELLSARNINFEFKVDEHIANLKLPMDVRKNLYLIYKEAINNLAKYSDARNVVFSITEKKNNLTMHIHDDGIGFDTSEKSAGNGLVNMKNRAEEIGGSLYFNSSSENGTSICLELPV